MRSNTVVLGPLVSDADGIATSQSPSGAGSLSLNGALVNRGIAVVPSPQQVSVTSTGADSSRVFVVTGITGDKALVSEQVTGVSSGTVLTTNFFTEVHSVTVDAATAGSITIGVSSTNGAVSGILVMDTYQNPFNVSIGAVFDGVVNVTIQHTFDNPLTTPVASLTWFNHPEMTGLTSNTDGNYAFPVKGVRAVLDSGSAGSVAVTVQQAGMPGRG